MLRRPSATVCFLLRRSSLDQHRQLEELSRVAVRGIGTLDIDRQGQPLDNRRDGEQFFLGGQLSEKRVCFKEGSLEGKVACLPLTLLIHTTIYKYYILSLRDSQLRRPGDVRADTQCVVK